MELALFAVLIKTIIAASLLKRSNLIKRVGLKCIFIQGMRSVEGKAYLQNLLFSIWSQNAGNAEMMKADDDE